MFSDKGRSIRRRTYSVKIARIKKKKRFDFIIFSFPEASFYSNNIHQPQPDSVWSLILLFATRTCRIRHPGISFGSVILLRVPPPIILWLRCNFRPLLVLLSQWVNFAPSVIELFSYSGYNEGVHPTLCSGREVRFLL